MKEFNKIMKKWRLWQLLNNIQTFEQVIWAEYMPWTEWKEECMNFLCWFVIISHKQCNAELN